MKKLKKIKNVLSKLTDCILQQLSLIYECPRGHMIYLFLSLIS